MNPPFWTKKNWKAELSIAVDMPSAWLGPFTHQSPVNHGHGLTAGPAEGKNRERFHQWIHDIGWIEGEIYRKQKSVENTKKPCF